MVTRSTYSGLVFFCGSLMVLGFATSAGAQAPTTPAKKPVQVAATSASTATATATASDTEEAEEKSPFSASLVVETSVGFGTFVSGPQNNSRVTTSFSPRLGYAVTDKVSLGLATALSWYNVVDFGTPLETNTMLLGDTSLSVSHSSIYKHDDSGFNLAGGISASLPTSLRSQFNNKIFGLRPSLTASIPVGPVKLSYTLALNKNFMTTSTPTLSCDGFDEECIEGRPEDAVLGYEAQRQGGEVTLPGLGFPSFSVSNRLAASWGIVEGLTLSGSVTISNGFGVVAREDDEFASVNATPGRSQSDVFSAGLGLGYQIMKHLAVGTSVGVSTARPFGAAGNGFFVFDGIGRASDNIASWGFSLTGSL